MNKAMNMAFTLIELLIVVAILATLAGIVLVGLGAFKGRGDDARRIADLRSVQNALELYYVKNKEYPNVSSWDALRSTLTTAGIGVFNIPVDPKSARSYSYAVESTNKQSYTLRAQLDDKDHPELKNDVDGTSNGLDCSDSPNAYYCVAF